MLGRRAALSPCSSPLCPPPQIDEDSSPRVWRSIHDWLDQASKLTFEHDPKKAERFGTVDFAQLRREAEEAEAACSALGSPVVFCHNDLLAPNILVEETASGPHGRAPTSAFVALRTLLVFVASSSEPQSDLSRRGHQAAPHHRLRVRRLQLPGLRFWESLQRVGWVRR